MIIPLPLIALFLIADAVVLYRYFSPQNINTSYQSGILVEGSTNAYFGIFYVNFDLLEKSEVRFSFISSIKAFQQYLSDYSKKSGILMSGTIGFGANCYQKITEYLPVKPKVNIFSFPFYTNDCKSTQADIFVHIHSTKQYAVYDASTIILKMLNISKVLTVFEETYGFVYKDSRDFTGFIDGTANPKGIENRSAAALDSEGNSFALVQRYIHDLNSWEGIDKETQEKTIGRTKENSIELNPLPPTSHVSRVDIKNDKGEGMKIVRHSLPYGTASGDKGLLFTAYCKNLETLDLMLKSMFGMTDNKKDRLLTFTRPITSGYYIIPNINLIYNLK